MSPGLAVRLRSSSVEVRCGDRGGGAGVIWSSDGLVVTNAHVARTNRPAVRLADGREFVADLVRRNTERDLALLRIEANGLNAAEIGDSTHVRAGQIVTAVGNPMGIVGAVSTGVIFSAGEGRWIEADVRLAPGNSGGMLADADGRVIGINTMIYSGLALAVPSNRVIDFVAGLEDQKPILGVAMRPVHLDGRPALVLVHVERDGRADRAGLMIGDVLLLTERELRAGIDAGGFLTLRYSRANRVAQVKIAIGAAERVTEGQAA